MKDHSNNSKNIIYSLISQIVVLGLALIVPRLIISNYGSDTNGLISTVTQITAYLALLESGIGRATRNELYKYIHNESYDKSSISSVISISKKTYQDTTKIYLLFVLLLSIILPFVIKTELSYLTVFLVILIEGLSNVLSYYYVQYWSDLLVADGKSYINTNIDLLYRIIIYVIKISLAILNVNIIIMEIGFFFAILVKLTIFRKYMRRLYYWIEYNNTGEKLTDKNSYIIAEIAWTVFSSTDLIILSVFCSTKSASVYSVYSLVFLSLNKILDAVYTSTKYMLGQTYHDNLEQYKTTHDLFNSIFIGTITAMMTVMYYLCIPFVELYTKGINDIEYVDKNLPFAFCMIIILSWSRMVAEHLNGIAGYAKQLGVISVIESFLNLFLSIALVTKYGIYGVLFATVISLPIKIIYCNWLSDKIIMKRKAIRTIVIVGSNILLFSILALIKNYIRVSIDSYLTLCIYGIVFTLISIILFLIINSVINKDIYKLIRKITITKSDNL